MNFKDRWITCETCDRKFVFTVGEQRRLHKLEQTEYVPTQCPTCRQVTTEGVKLIGYVKWYNPEKGYGFISKANGNEIFVHRTSLSEDTVALAEGARVEFEEQRSDKGPEAIKVAPLE